MPSAYYFVLPYAEDEGTQMLLVQRQLIQRRIAGKQAVYGQIPNWAGQWVLVGGKGEEKEPASEAALRLFREQTGIDLSEGQGQTYGVEKRALQELKDKAYNPFTIMFLELSGEGLKKLKSDIRNNINKRTVFDGVLWDADIVAGPLAPEKVGPIEPPANGWSVFLVNNYFDGVPPGMLDSTPDILLGQIKKRSKASAEWFKIAIECVPEKPITALLTGLEVIDASPSNGDWKATYQPGSFVKIRALTDPDTTEVHKLIEWTGGIEDADDRYGHRLVSLDQITKKDAPLIVKAEIVGSESPARSARFIIVPKFDDLEVSGAKEVTTDLWSADYSAEQGASVIVKAKLSPDEAEAYSHLEWSGGEQDDKNRNDRRLVPRNKVTAKGQPVLVKGSLNPEKEASVEIVPSAITLAVTNAVKANGNEYVANFDAANTNQITITATTTPDSPEAWSHIVWTGGAKGNADNTRLVPVDQVTKKGAPLVVTAEIDGGNSPAQSARFIIVPKFDDLEVSGAKEATTDLWSADYSAEQGASVIVKAKLSPDTAEAHSHLDWSGGKQDDKNPKDRRLVPRDKVTPKDQPVVVKASLNPEKKKSVQILPSAITLAVTNADKVNGNEYAANYDANNTNQITITATTTPNSPEAWSHIGWTGGAKGNADNMRLVPVDQVTKKGAPLVVTAEIVGSESPAQSARFIIVPKFDDLEVSGAKEATTDLWSADYSAEQGASVIVKAKLSPDEAEAYSHLEWSGGEQDDKNRNDRRLVPRNKVTAKGQPVLVKGSLNPEKEASVEIVPSAITLAVTNAVKANGNEYVANFDAANTNQITITATTTPDSPEAWSHIVWTGGAQGNADNTRLVPVDQITNAGVWIDVTAAIPGPHSAIARCRVVPRITALTVVAYGFPVQGQDWYTYVAANPPTVVAVTTAPATPAAWAQVNWTNTTGAGRAGNERVVARNNAGNIQITATIPNGDHPQLNLYVKTVQPLSDLTLEVLNITFDGGGSEVRSDANIRMGRQWVRGGMIPAPQTYPSNTAASLLATLDVTNLPSADIAIDVRATGFFLHANGGSTNVVWQQDNIAVADTGPQQPAFALTVGAPFLPDEVNYQDTGGNNRPLHIIWEMRLRDDGANWHGFDTTEHPFYVTLGAPVGNPRPYWTELKISCLAANGESVPANVIAAIYRPFAARNGVTGVNPQMIRANGVTLKYWYQHEPPNDREPGQENSAMLANPQGNGSCKAWAMMLVDMFRLHGINTGRVLSVKPNTGLNRAASADGFAIKNWTFDHPPASRGNDWSHTEGTNCRWVGGPGQNYQTPPMWFLNHYIVEETTAGTHYDPSYGSAARPDHQSWEDHAIDSLTQPLPPDLGFIKGAPNAPPTVLLLTPVNFPAY